MSKYENMRKDLTNWKLRTIYSCSEDPRVIVRNLLPFGWTWNFGHPRVFAAIALTIVTFLAPPYLAWLLGVRSEIAIGAIALLMLLIVMMIASRIARDPGE